MMSQRDGIARRFRRAHNPEIGSSNLPPAILLKTTPQAVQFIALRRPVSVVIVTGSLNQRIEQSEILVVQIYLPLWFCRPQLLSYESLLGATHEVGHREPWI